MNILMISDLYPPHLKGGYELMCQKVTAGLATKGHDVSVLTSNFGLATLSDAKGIYRRLNYIEERYANQLHRRFLQLQQAYLGQRNRSMTLDLVRELSPDVILLWNLEGISLQVYSAICDLDIPLIWIFGSHWLAHDKVEFDEPVSSLKHWYRSALLGFEAFETLELNHAIFVSNSLAQSYADVGFRLEHSAIIPNGIEESRITATESRHENNIDRQLRIVYVGRLEPEKGTDVAVQALGILQQQDSEVHISLDLIGEGQQAFVNELWTFVEERHLTDQVSFLGFVPHNDLIQKYAEYDVFLLPTPEFEGFPVTIVEAMSKGLPVIASDIGGPNDIVKHGKNGYLVAPGDASALAEQLLDLWEGRHKLPSLGKAAIETIREKFTADQMIINYEEFIEAAVA